jgi:hypothetical protein
LEKLEKLLCRLCIVEETAAQPQTLKLEKLLLRMREVLAVMMTVQTLLLQI